MRLVQSQRATVGDGKYTVVLDTYERPDGSRTTDFYALRHGERWRDLTGDGMILAMLFRIEELEAAECQSVPGSVIAQIAQKSGNLGDDW